MVSNGCFRRCLANSSRPSRRPRRQTEASSRASLAAERSHWTERSYVCQRALHVASPGLDSSPLTRPLLCFLPGDNAVGEIGRAHV